MQSLLLSDRPTPSSRELHRMIERLRLQISRAWEAADALTHVTAPDDRLDVHRTFAATITAVLNELSELDDMLATRDWQIRHRSAVRHHCNQIKQQASLVHTEAASLTRAYAPKAVGIGPVYMPDDQTVALSVAVERFAEHSGELDSLLTMLLPVSAVYSAEM